MMLAWVPSLAANWMLSSGLDLWKSIEFDLLSGPMGSPGHSHPERWRAAIRQGSKFTIQDLTGHNQENKLEKVIARFE